MVSAVYVSTCSDVITCGQRQLGYLGRTVKTYLCGSLPVYLIRINKVKKKVCAISGVQHGNIASAFLAVWKPSQCTPICTHHGTCLNFAYQCCTLWAESRETTS
jgi:hypothetical protein